MQIVRMHICKSKVDFGYRIPNTPEHLATASYLASN